jgi:peptide subunit release factor RF-3
VKYRLEAEYNVKTQFTTLPYGLARRVTAAGEIERATWPSNAKLVEDWDGKPIALFESEWSLRLAQEWNAGLAFAAFGEAVAVEVAR